MPRPVDAEGPNVRFHWAKLRAACHPTEDLVKVEAAVRFAAGLPQDTPLQVTTLDTHHGGTLRLVEVAVERNRPVRDLLSRVLALPGAREAMQATADRRTDDEGVFYFRLDKQAAFAGHLALVDGEDAVQVRVRLETYPATREAALAALQAFLAKPGRE